MQSIEIILIGVSLILSTAVIKLVDGIYHSIFSDRRYWIPIVLMLGNLLYCVNFLWSYHNNLSDETQHYAYYALSMLVSAGLLLRVNIIVSPEPSKIEDWHRHFEAVARRYFGVSALFSLASVFLLMAEGSSNGLDVVSLPFYIGAGLFVTAAVFEKASVRGFVAITYCLLVAVGGYTLFTQEML